MNRRSGLGRVFLVLLIVVVVGTLAYGACMAAGQAGVAVAPATGGVVYPVAWPGFGFGFGIFGFLFVLLLVGLLLRAFAFGGRGRGWGGPGHWDGSRWASGDVPAPMDAMLEAWHRRAHEPPASPTDTAGR
ncbi:MAG: hypothetical protein FJ038_03310 [Chloroflexi bacterium]|nr:hypothetical protein [Chloroflexota bacterium]